MNYIKRLQEENRQLVDTLIEMRSYLQTGKFCYPNDYVNVKDILNRIDNVSILLCGSEE